MAWRRGRPRLRVVLPIAVLTALVVLLAGATLADEPRAQPPPVPPASVVAPAGTTWRLDFADEFLGSSVDDDKWTTCWDWTAADCTESASALSGVERYTPEQVAVDGGVATLRAQRDRPKRGAYCWRERCSYVSGLLTTGRDRPSGHYRYSFRYGYAEARIAIDPRPGLWSTFWLLPRRTDLASDYTHEIDVLEVAGERAGDTLQTYHYAGRTQQYRATGCSPLRGGGFHTYGVDWRPDGITYYRDGRECGHFGAAADVYDKPMQLIVELMVLPSTSRDLGTTIADVPGTGVMRVDYVRVWRSARSSRTDAGSAGVGAGR